MKTSQIFSLPSFPHSLILHVVQLSLLPTLMHQPPLLIDQESAPQLLTEHQMQSTTGTPHTAKGAWEAAQTAPELPVFSLSVCDCTGWLLPAQRSALGAVWGAGCLQGWVTESRVTDWSIENNWDYAKGCMAEPLVCSTLQCGLGVVFCVPYSISLAPGTPRVYGWDSGKHCKQNGVGALLPTRKTLAK